MRKNIYNHLDDVSTILKDDYDDLTKFLDSINKQHPIIKFDFVVPKKNGTNIHKYMRKIDFPSKTTFYSFSNSQCSSTNKNMCI